MYALVPTWMVSSELRSGLGEIFNNLSEDFAIIQSEVLRHLNQAIRSFLEARSSIES